MANHGAPVRVRTRSALSFVDIRIALRDYLDAGYCQKSMDSKRKESTSCLIRYRVRWSGPVNTDKMIRPPRVVSAGAALVAGKPARHRALLVEDHSPLAEATAELMRLHGLEVRVATTGRDALQMVETFDPVLILCDMRLPDMAGLEVAEALRARCTGSDLLIAIITATSADCLREFEGQATTRGVNLFLSKPVTSETLIGLLSELEALQSR